MQDGAANVYTNLGAAVRTNFRISLWYFYYASAPGATTATASFASTDGTWMGAWSSAAMDPAPGDQTANNNSLGTTVTSGTTPTTTVADEIVFAAEIGSVATAPTYPPAGYTQLALGTEGVRLSNFAFAYKIVSATGAQSYTHACTSETWAALVSTFKGLAVAAPGLPTFDAIPFMTNGRI